MPPPPQPQPQVVVQQIIHKIPPHLVCKAEDGCENMGEGTCHIQIFCSDGGCGKKVCEDHRSKHCMLQGRSRRHYHEPIRVCTKCEPEVVSKLKKIQCVFFTLFFSPIICFCLCMLFGVIGGAAGAAADGGTSTTDDTTYRFLMWIARINFSRL